MIVAHVSDLHLKAGRRLAYRRVDTAAAFQRCVARLMALDPRPDVVLISGDLGDLGTAEEYGLFREIAAPLTMPVFAVPGNHDRREPMREALPKGSFAADAGTFLHVVAEDFPVRFVGIDSTIPGAPGGLFCATRAEWLARTLKSAPDKQTLLFLHHPPFLTGIAHMDRQNLAEAERLADVLTAHRQVSTVLCGHVHRFIRRRWAGTDVTIGPGVSHAVAFDLRPDGPSAFTMEPPAIHLLVIEPGQDPLSHLVPVDAFPGPYPFFGPDGALID